MASCHFK